MCIGPSNMPYLTRYYYYYYDDRIPIRKKYYEHGKINDIIGIPSGNTRSIPTTVIVVQYWTNDY